MWCWPCSAGGGARGGIVVGRAHLKRCATPRRATQSRLMRRKAAQRSGSKVPRAQRRLCESHASRLESLFLLGAEPSFLGKAERRDGRLVDAEGVHGFNERLALDSGLGRCASAVRGTRQNLRADGRFCQGYQVLQKGPDRRTG